MDGADHQDTQRDSESVEGLYVRNNGKDGVPNQASRTRCDAGFVDEEIESRLSGHWNSACPDIHLMNRGRENTHVLVTLDLRQ